MTPTAAVGRRSFQLVCSVIPIATTAMATKTPIAHHGYAGGKVLVTSIGSMPVFATTTKPTAMPVTRAPKVRMVDRKRPAAVTGNPLMASCTDETSRPVGSSSRMPPTTTISGAICIPTGLPKRDRSRAMKVTRNAHEAVMKKSGVRQRLSRRARRLTSRLETKATAEAPSPPPSTPTKTAENTANATVTIQRGNGLELRTMSSSRRTASSRPTPPATISVTSWCTWARPA